MPGGQRGSAALALPRLVRVGAGGGAAEGVGGRCERGAQGFPAPLLASSCSLGVISGHTPRGLSWARESFYGDTFRSEFLKTQSTATF